MYPNKYVHREYPVQLLDVFRIEMTHFESIHQIQLGIKMQFSKNLKCIFRIFFSLILNLGILTQYGGYYRVTICLIDLPQSTLKYYTTSHIM